MWAISVFILAQLSVYNTEHWGCSYFVLFIPTETPAK